MKIIKKHPLRNQKFFYVAVLLVGALLGFGMIYALTSRNDNGRLVSQQCNGSCVSLEGNRAKPDSIAVERGSYVQFNSADGKSHNLSLGSGGEEHSHKGKFHSGEFAADEAWRIQFNDEGSFYFHDHLNPNINILVVVYQPGKQYKVE